MPYDYSYGYRSGFGLGSYGVYIILMLVVVVLSLWAQSRVRSTYRKFSGIRNKNGITGQQAARYILDQNGLSDVDIVQISGELTDNYNPNDNVVYLSTDVYNGTSISAMGIAAHEVGHAIQHAKRYLPVIIRGRLVPAVNFSSRISWILIVLGLFLNSISELGYNIAVIGVILYSLATVFHLVTLPVELNASRRATAQINVLLSQDAEDIKGVKKVLSAAAMTYIAALAASAVNLLRMISIVGGRRRR